MQQVRIGLIGLGTIGSGVVRVLQERRAELRAKLGTDLVLAKICDLRLTRRRGVAVSRSLLTRHAEEVLSDPTIDIVIELIGGIEPARRYVLAALRAGKDVVTANKALLAAAGRELFEASRASGARLGFEASVGGGIPIIKALREGLISNRIEQLFGIINGTSNYILTKMTQGGGDFRAALAEAQAEGFAERDPRLDIDGKDAAHKLAILARLAFGLESPLKTIYCEGIGEITPADLTYAEELGYAIKPLAIAKADHDEVELRVHPTLVPAAHLLASVNGVFNAIYLKGDLVGELLFYGQGAGQRPTSSAVVSDVADLVRARGTGALEGPDRRPHHRPKTVKPMSRVETRYYIRMHVADRPGVLAAISSILGRHHISIASVTQQERRAAPAVPVVMMTHQAREANVRRAIAQIDRLASVKAKSLVLRVEAGAPT